jgi:hypothetical protein
MVISGAESGGSVHNTADTGTAVVIDVRAKLQLDVQHNRLDCDWENRMMHVAAEGLGIV